MHQAALTRRPKNEKIWDMGSAGTRPCARILRRRGGTSVDDKTQQVMDKLAQLSRAGYVGEFVLRMGGPNRLQLVRPDLHRSLDEANAEMDRLLKVHAPEGDD